MKIRDNSLHRYILIERAMDYLLLGWLILPTFRGTHHGRYSVHGVWLCDCQVVEPLAKEKQFVSD